jgi:hypothetical protein
LACFFAPAVVRLELFEDALFAAGFFLAPLFLDACLRGTAFLPRREAEAFFAGAFFLEAAGDFLRGAMALIVREQG